MATEVPSLQASVSCEDRSTVRSIRVWRVDLEKPHSPPSLLPEHQLLLPTPLDYVSFPPNPQVELCP
jgi:hypothetical protein